MLANDDKVIFVSGQGQGRVMRKLLDTAWLYETQQKANFSERAEEWSTFGTRGAAIVSHPDEPGRKVLEIRKVEKGWPASAVWNFPAGAAGRLKMRLFLQEDFQGGLISLTDHFSTPFDLEDHFHSVHNLWIGADGGLKGGGSLKTGQWHTLELAWNAKEQSCEVSIDEEPVGRLPVVRSSPNVCYLRLRSTADKTDAAGFLVESVEVVVDANRDATAQLSDDARR
jgi:hypothetical protein